MEERIQALRAREPDAVDWLVDSFSDRLLRAATLILGDQHAAEDAVQDCLIDAVTYLHNFRGEASVYTWLYTILVRRCRRQQKGIWKKLHYLPTGVLERTLFENGRYAKIPEIGEKWALRKAISSLTYKYREVVVLFYYEEFSIEEISLLLSVPQGTIKNRLFRARSQLREILEREEEQCL